MYGMVNNAIKNLILENYGEKTWQEIKNDSGVDEEIFISMKSNPDEPTYNMAISATKILDIELDPLLVLIGEYWITHTAREGYKEMLDMFGNNLEEFLQNLNHLHSRVQSVMPDLNPPTFHCEIGDQGIIVLHYYTERPHLAPMVTGILQGLSKRFKEPAEISQVAFKGEHDHDIFEIRII